MRTAALALALAIVVVPACKSGKESESPAARSYTVRGKVVALPTEGAPSIAIHHEEIPEFVGRSGKTQPMMAMEMPFGVGDEPSLEGIEPGDVVEFTFEVDFARQPPTRITAIEELPAETELEL